MIRRHHHITLCTGGVQEDYDFHTKVLSLKSVKKTALYDGATPIYHLYYGNDTGDVSTLITTFPMRQSGRKSRRGSGQTKTLQLSVPSEGFGFWGERLQTHGFAPVVSERLGERVIQFQHPCGIDYELVAVDGDPRKPRSDGEVPPELAIRGTHGITVSVRDTEASEEFMHHAWSGKKIATDGKLIRYKVGDGGAGTVVDFVLEPDLKPASWTYGEGVVHHTAFEVDDYAVQDRIKFELEGLGFTDTSERKDRGYFDSIYVRTPAGAMFEATVSKPKGMLVDETYEKLGTSFQVPPVFAARTKEILDYLDPLLY